VTYQHQNARRATRVRRGGIKGRRAPATIKKKRETRGISDKMLILSSGALMLCRHYVHLITSTLMAASLYLRRGVN